MTISPTITKKLPKWRCRLQTNYLNFDEFNHYAEINGLHIRLGYNTPIEAWVNNPLVEGSVNPHHFKKVKN